MVELMRKFTKLNGKMATIILEHCWFGQQKFKSENINIIEDDNRLGLNLRGQDVFVLRDKLREVQMDEHTVMFADDKLKISIKF